MTRLSLAAAPRPVGREHLDDAYWDRCVDSHPHGWWFHRTEWLRYALAYTPDSVDKSHAIMEAVGQDTEKVYAQALALVPIIVDATDAPVCGGQVLPAALPNDEDALVIHDHPVRFRPGQEAPDYDDLPDDVKFTTTHTHVVDLLDGEEAAHWARVRKSYHSLIRKAQREYDITIHSHVDNWGLTEQARILHLAAAGRETRSILTWLHMDDWMKTGHGVLALAREKASGTMCGFAYAIRYKDWAYWASGATRRPNLQHALQWELMSALRHDEKTRYYEVGADADEHDGVKAQGIAFFKGGLGGTRWPVVEMTACEP